MLLFTNSGALAIVFGTMLCFGATFYVSLLHILDHIFVTSGLN